MPPPELDKKIYGPDCTPAEMEALGAQLYWYEPQVLMYTEAPVLSLFQLDVYHRKLDELAAEVDEFQMIIDITRPGIPNAEQRAKLREMYGTQAKLTDAAAVTGRNFVINIAAKFVLGGLRLRSFTVHRTLEQAREALRAAKS